jgi:hypothetical protein
MGREWYFDNHSSTLYYKPNTTTDTPPNGSPPNGSFVATQHRVLFNLSGTQAAPIHDVTIKGLVLRDTAFSYFDPHGLPSGGDWALAKQGAVTIVGAEGVSVENCLLTRLDGNAVFIGGYGRNLR